MEERLRFVAQLLERESMTDLCRQFGISRKTGYKIFDWKTRKDALYGCRILKDEWPDCQVPS